MESPRFERQSNYEDYIVKLEKDKAYCKGCRKGGNKMKMPKENIVQELKTALEFAKGAIKDAIYCEDGLDGAAGESVIEMINDALSNNCPSCKEKDQEIASLQNQLTEAQGKSGKVVSVEEIGKVMDRFVYVGTHKIGIMLMKEARDKIATAIFKAVYGGDKNES